MRIRFPAICVALALTGCEMFGGGNDSVLRKNPSFQDGYEDGCEAATDQGADLRDRTLGDAQRLNSDAAYRAGWNNGLQACRRTNSETSTPDGMNPPLAPEPGGGH